MKKLVALMGLMTMGLGSAMAQETGSAADAPKSAVGMDVDFLSWDQGSTVGIGAKYQWKVGKKKRLYIEPSIHYYFPTNVEDELDGDVKASAFDAIVNFKWMFPLGKKKKFSVYPIAGIGYSISKNINYDTMYSDGKPHYKQGSTGSFTFDAGLGLQYDFSSQWAAVAEGKTVYIGGQALYGFAIGAAYKF